jgi:putative acetyltransferase
VTVRIVDVDPQGEVALSLLREAAVEVRALYDDVLPPDRPWPVNTPLGSRDVYLVAYLDQQPVACGALRLETGNKQTPAMALYEAFGFYCIAPSSAHENDPTSVCFELPLYV